MILPALGGVRNCFHSGQDEIVRASQRPVVSVLDAGERSLVSKSLE